MKDGMGISEEVLLAIVFILCLTVVACVESCTGKQPDTAARQAAEEVAR